MVKNAKWKIQFDVEASAYAWDVFKLDWTGWNYKKCFETQEEALEYIEKKCRPKPPALYFNEKGERITI